MPIAGQQQLEELASRRRTTVGPSVHAKRIAAQAQRSKHLRFEGGASETGAIGSESELPPCATELPASVDAGRAKLLEEVLQLWLASKHGLPNTFGRQAG